jgi:hypothetical protein
LADDTLETIRNWVQEHEVCWEIAPKVEMLKGQGVVQTGLELNVYAQVEHAAEAEVAAIFEKAEQLVEQLMPHSELPLLCSIGAFDHARHLRKETGYAAEVCVPVELSFSDPRHRPSSKEVEQCVAPIEARLRELGLKPRSWDSRR